MAIEKKALLKRIDEVFQFADNESKDSLSWKDYKVAMVALIGRKPYKWEVNEIFDGTKSGRLSREEFQNIAAEKMKQKDQDTHIREIFSAFDHQWKGYLVADDLEFARQQEFPDLSKFLLKEAFYEADVNCDGRVGYKEFYYFLTGRNILH